MPPTPDNAPDPRGPLLMVAASASFTGMVTLVKTAREWDLGTLELMGWRSLVAIPVLLLATRSWRVKRPRVVLLRCAFGFCAMFGYFAATHGLGIGELTLLTKLQPVLVAVVAPWVLGSSERPSPGTWWAVVLGFTGTLAIAWPSIGTVDVRAWSVLAGLGAAAGSTAAHTTLRALKDESPAAVVSWFQLAVGIAVVVGMLALGQRPHVPTASQLPALGSIGLFALVGQLLMTRAYSLAPAARVAAAGFVGPLFGFAVDALVFRHPPGPHALMGALCILGAGGVLVRDGRRAR